MHADHLCACVVMPILRLTASLSQDLDCVRLEDTGKCAGRDKRSLYELIRVILCDRRATSTLQIGCNDYDPLEMVEHSDDDGYMQYGLKKQ